MSSKLESQWIDIFKPGAHGGGREWTSSDLDQIAADYNPTMQEAPVVVGHPAIDDPSYGWVKSLRVQRNGSAILQAQLHQVEPQFEDMVQQGRFKQRSVALYTKHPTTGRPYLKHLGFLGAGGPRVKGLRPIQFGDAEHIEFAVTIEGAPIMAPVSDPKKTPTLSEEHVGLLTRFAERVKEFFAKVNDNPPASPDIEAALTKQRTEMEASFGEQFKALKKELTEAAAAATKQVLEISASQTKGTIQAFVDKLSAAGKWLPAFEKAYGLQSLMERLANSDVVLTFTEKVTVGDKVEEKEVKRSALEVLQRFFGDLPEMVNFDHISKKARSAAARGGRVAFTEPPARTGKEVVNIELDQKVRAMIAESKKTNPDRPLNYTEAYRLAREELQEQARGQDA